MMNKKTALIIGSFLPAITFAAERAATTGGATNGLAFIGAGLAIGLAAAVAAYSQSQAAVAALEGIARNPASSGKVFVPLILSLALMESLVLFAFLVANSLVDKI